MYGPQILVRTLSSITRSDRYGNAWQYHSRSDHHSKVACWGVVFDLLVTTPLLRRHVEAGIVHFGINHEMRDFVHDRKKNLDLVLCTPNGPPGRETLVDVAETYGIVLTPEEEGRVHSLPPLTRAPVGSVLMALEAKACMTAHQRALPRLYDELQMLSGLGETLTDAAASQRSASTSMLAAKPVTAWSNSASSIAQTQSRPERRAKTG